MDYETIKTVVLLGNTVVVIVVAFVQWLDRKAGVPLGPIKELERRVNEKCERIAKLELDMQSFPTKAEVVRIHERIDGLNNTLNQQIGVLKDTLSKDAKDVSLLLGKIIGQIEQLTSPRRDT